MKYEIHYSPAALADLDDVWDYIFSELVSPSAAKHTVEKIMDSVDRLTDFPEMGAPLATITDMESDYRFLVCGNYLVFYRVAGAAVYIDRVLYGRRNYMRILFPELPEGRDDS